MERTATSALSSHDAFVEEGRHTIPHLDALALQDEERRRPAVAGGGFNLDDPAPLRVGGEGFVFLARFD
nr:hypothetical protein [Anaerolineae bacterium]